MELTKTDLNFVLTRVPKDILDVLKKHPGKVFLAGGFIRSVISGEKVSDVDLFGVTEALLLDIAKDLAVSRKGRYFKTDNALTVLAPPRHPVQLITRWLFTGPAQLIESFDFTVCQAVIWCEQVNVDNSTRGPSHIWHSLCSEHFYADLAARRLVYTSPKREEEPGGSILRAFKFVGRGWNIQAPSISKLCARLINGIAGLDSVNEEVAARSMIKLLQQVDPLRIIDGVDVALDEHEVIQP